MWVQVSAERAERHRLYGLGGWLRVFSVLFTLTAIVGPLFTLAIGARVLQLPPEQLMAGLALVVVMLMETAASIVLAVLWFRLAPHFLRAFAEISALSTLLDLAGEMLLRQLPPLPEPFPQPEGNILAGTALDLILCAIPFLLLWRSRRFRVTFRHEVRDGEG